MMHTVTIVDHSKKQQMYVPLAFNGIETKGGLDRLLKHLADEWEREATPRFTQSINQLAGQNLPFTFIREFGDDVLTLTIEIAGSEATRQVAVEFHAHQIERLVDCSHMDEMAAMEAHQRREEQPADPFSFEQAAAMLIAALSSTRH